MAFLLVSMSNFGTSKMTHQNGTVQKHFVFKRQQNNFCLLGMVPPLGASVQYSQGGGVVGNAPGGSVGPFPSGTIASMLCVQGGISLGPSTAVCLNGIWQPPVFSGCSLSSAGGVFPASAGGIFPASAGGIFPASAGGLFPASAGGLFPASAGLSSGLCGLSSVGQCLSGVLPLSLGLGNVIYTNGENQFSGRILPALSQHYNAPRDNFRPSVLGSCSQSNAFSSFGTGLQQQQSCLIGPSAPLNGNIQYSSGSLVGSYPVGTMATLFCNPGFVPSGQTTATCQIGGQFLPSILGPCVMTGKRRR
uniref:Sushi domain-containing protein n=1 Tax=Globodera pallida TaxID=36090 RepID=A0A183CCF9_GLOPA